MFYDELNIIRYRLYSILRTPKYNFDLIKAKRKGYNDIYINLFIEMMNLILVNIGNM